VTNIEYGNIDFEKVIIESMLTKFENWKRTPHGGGGGVGGDQPKRCLNTLLKYNLVCDPYRRTYSKGLSATARI